MNKSAIEKMVEWLEEKVNPNNNEILSNADHLVVETYHEALKKAISLLAEEQNAPAITGKLITGAEWAEYQRLKEQKPTAPAGNIICGICPSEMERKVIIRTEKGERQVATIVGYGDLVFFQGGYRPAPSSADEGLRKELEAWMSIRPEMDRTGLRMELRQILARHPSTAKSEDRCDSDIVPEIRQRVTDYFNQSAWPTEFMEYAHMISDKMHDILDEFSKDADGEEWR